MNAMTLLQVNAGPTISVAALLVTLAIIVGGMKRFGCIDAAACPSLPGLALAGLVIVGFRMVL